MRERIFGVTGAVLFLVAIFVLRHCSSKALALEKDWAQALERARSEKKPLLLIFGGNW